MDPLGAVGREYNKNIDQTSISELNRTLMELDEETLLRGLVALEKAGVPINGEGVAAARHATTDAAEDNPIGDGVGAVTEHLERRLLTEIALENNELPTFPDKPILGQQVYPDIHHYDKLDGDLVKVDLDKIEVDAKTFQFKTDANAEGVNMTLQGIDTWNPIFAQTIISYEYANGRLFVADGHQRVGLAKRLKAANPELDIPLYSHLLRETDGVTPEQARVVAALANMAHASPPQIIDAAKVLRVDPAKIAELPAMSVFVRQARDLVELSDEAFGLIINEIVPAQYGSLVGRLVPDAEKQMAVLQILAKTEPSNALQAEAIIRQARDTEFKQATQDTLFGAEEFTQSLFLERARVLESTLKLLKNDRRVFNSLVENQKRIETEGNRLDEASNVQRSMTDGQALEIIKAQADKKGPISDALNLAAKEYAEGRSLAETSRTVADAVRRAVDGGDVDGRTVSPQRIDADVAEEGNRLAAGPERLDDFDEPNGAGSERQADTSEATLREETDIKEAAQPDVALEDIKNPIPLDATPARKVAALQELTATNRPLIDDFLVSLDAKFGTESKSSEKLPERILEKSTRPSVLATKPWHNVEHIRDSLRFKTQLDDIKDLPAIINEIRSGLGAEIIKADVAKFITPKEWGFRIVAFDLRMPNGQIVEYYLPLREIEAVKDVNHKLFEKWRNEDLTKLSPAQITAMLSDQAESVARFQSAYNRYLERTGQSESELVAALNSSLDASGPTIEKSLYISSTVNDSALVQTPSTRSATNPGVSTNARPSSEIPAVNDSSIPTTSDPNIIDSAPVRNAENTPQGQQTLVEGVEPITDATRAQAAVDAPLTGGNRPMDEGLFDTAARGQGDLLDMDIPVGQRVDADGNMVAENQTVREMLQEFDQDKNMIKRLEGCV